METDIKCLQVDYKAKYDLVQFFDSTTQRNNKSLGYCEGTGKQILKKNTKRSKKLRLASTSFVTKSLNCQRSLPLGSSIGISYHYIR